MLPVPKMIPARTPALAFLTAAALSLALGGAPAHADPDPKFPVLLSPGTNLYNQYYKVEHADQHYGEGPGGNYVKNQAAFTALANENFYIKPLESAKARATSISLEDAENIRRAVLNNPIAANEREHAFDPKGGIGFCFGRAFTADKEADFRGVAKTAVRKAWVVGSMDGGWGFHVTTMIYGGKDAAGKNVWITTDPIWGQAMPIEDWYQNMIAGYDSKKSIRIYFTQDDKFGPSVGEYDPVQLGLNLDMYQDFYSNYFKLGLKLFRMANKGLARSLHNGETPRRGPNEIYQRSALEYLTLEERALIEAEIAKIAAKNGTVPGPVFPHFDGDSPEL